jgi:hypothetical protein
MINSIKLIIIKLTSNPKNIFLLDSIGAFLTALLLGFVLVEFQDAFGMPQKTLYFLSALALAFALYSSCCYYFIPSKWNSFLSVIVVANILYCCLTTGLIFYHFQTLTILGLTYFILEIIIIVCLIFIEIKGLKSQRNKV